jgi:hypothetical protein
MLNLPDKGSPQANWAQNAGRLREQMGQGRPIFDSYRDPVTGMQIPTRGFLGAERNLLTTRRLVLTTHLFRRSDELDSVCK